MAGLKRRIHVGKGLPFFIFLKSAVCGAWRIIRALSEKFHYQRNIVRSAVYRRFSKNFSDNICMFIQY